MMPAFCVFFVKTTPYGEIFQNSVPRGFTASPIAVLCGNLVKFGRREIGKVVRYIPDIKKNKISLRSPALTSARIASKICHASPRQCTQSAPYFIQIGSLSAEFNLYPNASTERAPK